MWQIFKYLEKTVSSSSAAASSSLEGTENLPVPVSASHLFLGK
jgi:hypothetical protein